MTCVFLLLSFVPLIVSILGVCFESYTVMLLVIPVLFAMVRFLPFCHKRENLWMFVFAAMAVIPINIHLIHKLNLPYWVDNSTIMCCLWSVLLFLMLLSVEEIVLGLITRFIWKRQYRLPRFFD